MDQFIEVYDNALSTEFCQQCVAKFDVSEEQHKGRTGHGIDLIKKNSSDITISQSSHWQTEMNHLQQVMH